MDRESRRRSGAAIVATGLLAGAVAGCSGSSATSAPPAPSAAAAPASAAAAATTPLFLTVDTVLGPKNLTDAEKPTKTCVQANRFAHNEQVVWRVRVTDATGQPMDDKSLSAVQVKFADKSLKLRYGPHPKDNPVGYFWTVSWTVPEGYPSGTLDYTVVATATDGRTGTWEQIKVPYAMLRVTDDVRPVLPSA